MKRASDICRKIAKRLTCVIGIQKSEKRKNSAGGKNGRNNGKRCKCIISIIWQNPSN